MQVRHWTFRTLTTESVVDRAGLALPPPPRGLPSCCLSVSASSGSFVGLAAALLVQ